MKKTHRHIFLKMSATNGDALLPGERSGISEFNFHEEVFSVDKVPSEILNTDFEPCEIFDKAGNDILDKDMLEEKIADSTANDVYLETDARRLCPEVFKREFIPLLVQLLNKENIEKVVLRLVGHLAQADEGFECIFASTIDDVSLFEPFIPFGKCGLNKLHFASDYVKIWCWSKGEGDIVTRFMDENFSCIGAQFDEVPVGFSTTE